VNTSFDDRSAQLGSAYNDDDDRLHYLRALLANLRWVIGIPLVLGTVAFGLSFLIKPVFTASTVFLPPQAQQGQGSAALATLGALSALAGSSFSMWR
jgi:LPS O-antigen subunit length determinant protein (WzzB/FepE family)